MGYVRLAGLLGLVLVVGCSEPERLGADGPIGRMVVEAAQRHEVPPALMLAIAEVEGGLRLRPMRSELVAEEIPVAGALELRHGAFDSLGRGAELMGESELALQRDLALGTEAGARVLAALAHEHGIDRARLEAWAPVLEQLSGHRQPEDREAYRARVFGLLRRGGTLRARDGETIELAGDDSVPVALVLVPPRAEPLAEPEYPGAIWFDTSCSGKCNTTRNAAISMIAIHDTEGGWDASVATLQNDPGKSVHYIVDADGSRVGQFIPESYDGWHVGNSYYNNRMVGIEHVGFAGIDDYATAMYEASADLVKSIADRNELTVSRDVLIAHQEVPNGNVIAESSPPCTDSPGSCVENSSYGGANHHTDPGVYWEWCQYMELAGGSCKCNDAYELWNCVHDLSMMARCADQPSGTVEIVHCADTCVVEPIGVDDHCTPVSEGSGGQGGGGVGGGAGVGGAGASGAASAAGGADPGASADLEPCEHDEGCALATRPVRGGRAPGLALLLFAIGVCSRRFEGSRQARARPRRSAER